MSYEIEYSNKENNNTSKQLDKKVNQNELYPNKISAFISGQYPNNQLINHQQSFNNDDEDNDEFYKDFLLKIKDNSKSDKQLLTRNNNLSYTQNNASKSQQKKNHTKLKTAQFINRLSSNESFESNIQNNTKRPRAIRVEHNKEKVSSFNNQKDKTISNTTLKKRKAVDYNDFGGFSFNCPMLKDKDKKPQLLVIERIKSIEDIGRSVQKVSFKKSILRNNEANSNNKNYNTNNCIGDNVNTNKQSVNIKFATGNNDVKNEQLYEEKASNKDINDNKQLCNVLKKQRKKSKGLFCCCLPR